jgi:glutamate-ammonia-ligase adenylyltransferase
MNISFPAPADEGAADRLTESFAALGVAYRAFAEGPGLALLRCLGGNAPYLADLALAEPDYVLAVMEAGPGPVLPGILLLLRDISPAESRAKTARALRLAKKRAALVIAIADLGGMAKLPWITGALSQLAEVACGVAVRHLLRGLHEAGQISLADPDEPERQSGFVALALGKLGGAELNYSSDIDLVLLYDPENLAYPPEAQPIFARFARDLVTLLSARDENGYVFRVDLRLRPDPAATPAVISLPAALTYYESHGRTWERAAFSKARPIAGDLPLGQKFLAAIKPFIWRKHLDFAAVADIHDMKRRIDSGRPHDLLGFDVKLGRGGIREIEFVVQTMSLVWGGQESLLRIPATLNALPALVKAGHLPEAVGRALAADYTELRRIEHRLQMVEDRQTHLLPSTEAGLEAFIVFLNASDFRADFARLLARVHGHFEAFFAAGAPQEGGLLLDPHGGAATEALAARLQNYGFSDTKHIIARLNEWGSTHMPALRSERARDLLQTLLPSLLQALGRQPEPDRVFGRFDTLLSRQRAGVQLLSLLQRNQVLLARLAAVLGAAPALSEYLAEDAQALEALLVPASRFAAPRPVLRRMLAEARDLEEAVSMTRRFVRREEFHLSVATLEGRLDADAAGLARARLAEAALQLLLPLVLAQHVRRYGRIKAAKIAIVALGKAGSAEMLAGSDLDLMMIYDHAPMETPPTPYFVRFCHAFTGALTARGPEGPLYRVDMRLRPSGNQGPVAVSLAAFQRYHALESWTWERLALTRGRVLAATKGFAPVVAAAIRAALSRPVPEDVILADTVAMRDRLRAEQKSRGVFDVKHRPGGLLELAFIPEALQLLYGAANPAVLQPNTSAALRALVAAGYLAPADATALVGGDKLWRSIQGIARITGLNEADMSPPPAMLIALLGATGAPDLAGLLDAMARAAETVQDCFQRYIERK